MGQTQGEVLIYNNKICNTVFYKCCGGITEYYSTAWEDKSYGYLVPVWDGEQNKPLPDFTKENVVKEFIDSKPKDIFCNTTIDEIQEYLTDFDKQTTDFFRWKVKYNKKFLQELIEKKTNKIIGELVNLVPLKRGASGRICSLEIQGTKNNIVVSKELEIRKVLSETHLYSSCFYVLIDGENIILNGAGWGHGVGLCQIGAAVMAKKGYNYKQILSHYYPGSRLAKIY